MEGVCARGRLCHYAHGIRELNYKFVSLYSGKVGQIDSSSDRFELRLSTVVVKLKKYDS